MSIENVVRFYEVYEKYEWLVEDLKRAQCMEDAIIIANEAGFDFDQNDLQEYAKLKQSNMELSDEELEMVSGGRFTLIGGCSGKPNLRCYAQGCVSLILYGECKR